MSAVEIIKPALVSRALDPRNLYCAYQPIVDLDEGAIVAYAAHLAADDALAGEWTVIVVGSHYAGALIAKDCGDTGPEDDRRFEFVVTHDRALVLDAARSLMSRLVPLS